MAYRIDYGKGTTQKINIVNQRTVKNLGAFRIIIITILACLALYRWAHDNFWQKMIPGDVAVTESATIRFAEEIQNGSTFTDAFTVFCKEVIDGAKIQDHSGY